MFAGESYPAGKKDRIYTGGCGTMSEVSQESDREQIADEGIRSDSGGDRK